MAVAVAVATLAMSAVACGPKSPDFQSILSTSPTTSAVSTTTEVPVPLWKYLESVGVTGAPVAPSSLTDLTVSIPTPPGWAPMKNPNITPNTEMIAKGESYPTAMLMVFKLHQVALLGRRCAGWEDDPVPGVQSPAVQVITALNHRGRKPVEVCRRGVQFGEVRRQPGIGSAMLERFGDIEVPVQLTITSLANEAVKHASDIEAIIAGFVVAAK